MVPICPETFPLFISVHLKDWTSPESPWPWQNHSRSAGSEALGLTGRHGTHRHTSPESRDARAHTLPAPDSHLIKFLISFSAHVFTIFLGLPLQ